MVDRVSALDGHYKKGRFGEAGEAGLMLQEIRDLTLHQVAAWPETLTSTGNKAARVVGKQSAPGPCAAAVGKKGALLRIEPLKWWVFGVEAPKLKPADGTALDISHSRTHLRVSGARASEFLNRNLPLDLRDEAFPVGSVASSSMHHVGVTLWRSDHGYELFMPRGFALSLWEVMFETAQQFGVDIL